MPRPQPPGPYTSAPKVPRVEFRFDDEARRELLKWLVAALRVPDPTSVLAYSLAALNRGAPQPVADRIVDMAQERIVLLRSGRAADLKAAPANVPNIREAILRLRVAMEGFTKGWVDLRTAGIADWQQIDAALAQRDEELKALRRREPDEDARFQAQLIVLGAQGYARQGGFDLDEKDALAFVARVLEVADVSHPDIYEHPARFRKFVFGDEA